MKVNKFGIEQTDDEDVINWINRCKKFHSKEYKKEANFIYITTECLEKLNEIFCVNSTNVLMNAKTILGLEIIEITPLNKFTYKEFLDMKHEITITSLYTIYKMVDWYKPSRIKKWQN